ncbi:MAG TPA: tetratricopeptide repeat protein [Vicinamibacterales bacterium]|jgi:tetratricopeptide (TPR) repeat protein|nr:tetratricopeptide repeat protein [Vicinamibacterales bacterium]
MRVLSGASAAVGQGNWRSAVAVLALGSLASVVGCAKVGQIAARKDFKEANQAYQQQDYKKSAGLYEKALEEDPTLVIAYFYLGNSYDNLYKPSKKGDADNEALLQKAVSNYEKAADKLAAAEKPDDRKLGKLALEYLVSTYGPDKLNDPSKAEPIVQKMIQLEPTEPGNYFQLAKIYEDAGVYDEAERMLIRAKEAKPSDPAVYMTLAGYYNRQGQFDKTIDALEQRAAKEPKNPEAFYTISTFYWDKAFRDVRLKDGEKKDMVVKGIEAVDRALQIKPDYAEALVYKGLLLRLQANLEKDPAKQQALIKQADQLRDRATELRKQKAAGVSY